MITIFRDFQYAVKFYWYCFIVLLCSIFFCLIRTTVFIFDNRFNANVFVLIFSINTSNLSGIDSNKSATIPVSADLASHLHAALYVSCNVLRFNFNLTYIILTFEYDRSYCRFITSIKFDLFMFSSYTENLCYISCWITSCIIYFFPPLLLLTFQFAHVEGKMKRKSKGLIFMNFYNCVKSSLTSVLYKLMILIQIILQSLAATGNDNSYRYMHVA